MKSYVAVQKKLLVIVFAFWKKNVRFTEDYINDNTREKELVSSSLVSLVQAEGIKLD
jgi:transposase